MDRRSLFISLPAKRRRVVFRSLTDELENRLLDSLWKLASRKPASNNEVEMTTMMTSYTTTKLNMAPLRFAYLVEYCRAVNRQPRLLLDTPAHAEFCLSVARSRREPVLNRMLCYEILAFANYINWIDMVLTVKYSTRAMRLLENNSSDGKKSLRDKGIGEGQHGLVAYVEDGRVVWKTSRIMREFVAAVARNFIETVLKHRRMRQLLPKNVTEEEDEVAIQGRRDASIVYVSSMRVSSGVACDHCEVSVLDPVDSGSSSEDGRSDEEEEERVVELRSLKRCARCERAHYCSQRCQIRDWKQRHRRMCRLPGVIAVGDIVRVTGLVGKVHLNGTVAMVLALNSGKDHDRITVRVIGGDRIMIRKANVVLKMTTEEFVEVTGNLLE